MLRQQSVQNRATIRQSVLHYQAYSCRNHKGSRTPSQTELRTSATHGNNSMMCHCCDAIQNLHLHLLEPTCKRFRSCNQFLARQRAYNVHPSSLLLRLIPFLHVSRSKGAQRNVIVGRMRAMLQALCAKSWGGLFFLFFCFPAWLLWLLWLLAFVAVCY